MGRHVLGFDRETGNIWVHPVDSAYAAPFTYAAWSGGGKALDSRIVVGLDDDARQLIFHRSETTTVEVVDLPVAPRGLPEGLRGVVSDGIVAADGRIGMVRQTGERPQLFDLRTGKALGDRVPQRDKDPGNETGRSALSQDGRQLAFVDGGSVVVWDTSERKEVFRKEPADHWIDPVALSPDGSLVAAFSSLEADQGNGDYIVRLGTIRVWDTATGKQLHSFRTEKKRFAFSPDNSRFVTAAGDVLDLRTGKRRQNAFGPIGTTALAFAPDGNTLAVAKENGLTELWDASVSHRTGGVLASEAIARGGDRYGQSVGDLAFSPDGRLLAALIGGDAVQFWDMKSRLALGRPLPMNSAGIRGLAFDGSTLRTVDTQNPLRSLDTDPGKLIDAVCRRVAGRELTEDEWKQYVPRGIEYRKVCS